MPEAPIKRIVIVGGGTAGWMTAAALSKHLERRGYPVRLIESEEIGTIGVGEATVPPIREFNRYLELDEAEFLRATNGSFKLGIRFENWGHIGNEYSHPFGTYGFPVNQVAFQHYWLRMRQQGDPTRFFEYSLPHMALTGQRFAPIPPAPGHHGLNHFYAYHIDASLYARYLRGYAEQRGVVRSEGKIVDVIMDPGNGDIQAVQLDSGEKVEGDFFIDCSGFRGLLIEQALGTGWVDWSHWLPCNRAWAVPTRYREANETIPPYTRSRALQAGWQWRVPLQHRSGDGHVFCSEYIEEERARETLLENIEGEPLAEPRLLQFTTGMRRLAWNRNCVAIGLSSGFLEPLESTSIHLIQVAITNLLRFVPNEVNNPDDRDEFNRVMKMQNEETRDFIILHYHATEREDNEFWRYCRHMEIPAELQRRISLFRASGVTGLNPYILFIEHSWLAVMIGQGIVPERYDPRADNADEATLRKLMQQWKTTIRETAAHLPRQNEALDRMGARATGVDAMSSTSGARR